MIVDSIPIDIRTLKCLEKILISKFISCKKITLIHGKRGFSKIKGKVCNVPISNICNILPMPSADFNGLNVVKLKSDLKYMDYVYSEIRHVIINIFITYSMKIFQFKDAYQGMKYWKSRF